MIFFSIKHNIQNLWNKYKDDKKYVIYKNN